MLAQLISARAVALQHVLSAYMDDVDWAVYVLRTRSTKLLQKASLAKQHAGRRLLTSKRLRDRQQQTVVMA